MFWAHRVALGRLTWHAPNRQAFFIRCCGCHRPCSGSQPMSITGALSCSVGVFCLLRPGGDGLCGSWPGSGPIPERRGVVARESVAGESIVVDPVELQAGVSEVTCAQAGI